MSTMRPNTRRGDMLTSEHDVPNSQLWLASVRCARSLFCLTIFPAHPSLTMRISTTALQSLLPKAQEHCAGFHHAGFHHAVHIRQMHNHLPSAFHKPPWSPNATTSPQPFSLFRTYICMFSLQPASLKLPCHPLQGLHNKIRGVGLSSDFVGPGYITPLSEDRIWGAILATATAAMIFPTNSSLLNIETLWFHLALPCRRPKAA